MVPSLVSTITALFSKPHRMDVEVGGFELAFRSTADDAYCPLCMEYTNTMTGVRSRNGLNGSVGVSR